MERIAFHLEIIDGQRDAYRETHENVHDALEEAYLESDAGIETYSVFERDGHVFGFLELEDPNALKTVMNESEAQADWDEVMDGILEPSEDGGWMDEVYRLR
ncbi:L-rhamnose mutarotase [Natronolimnobius sp. AArcel1]|uniref:L-rhamnose mutarotase n=1 Tax=Natronolimnobius sp. AArcel1 TaxID=1679093 RepID=UPI0013ECFF71|nr:L-rhamnose mutarotase [Natronolimnobius sp. AArcel1]NGM67737.1 L-rhamnose mutarotase [Natronolimnobius sp. AArcel1]